MELVRENKQKHRKVYFCGDRYRKIWSKVDSSWIEEHVRLLNTVVPGYVLAFGNNWIEFRVIPGKPASTMPHSPEFAQRIYKFCKDSIQKTFPYVHGDWSLSNIIVNGDDLTLCDWDNLGIYPAEEVEQKLVKDLTDAFGKAMMLHVLPSEDPSVAHLCLDQ